MKRTLLLALPAAILLSSIGTSTYAKGEYYRWTGDDGVIHYGARPPEGVEAELISTWGKSMGESTASAKDGEKAKSTAGADEERKAIAAERQQQCDDEKQRISTLQRPGRRIRMEQPDGSTRFLSPEEIAQEIATSREFINQACN